MRLVALRVSLTNLSPTSSCHSLLLRRRHRLLFLCFLFFCFNFFSSSFSTSFFLVFFSSRNSSGIFRASFFFGGYLFVSLALKFVLFFVSFLFLVLFVSWGSDSEPDRVDGSAICLSDVFTRIRIGSCWVLLIVQPGLQCIFSTSFYCAELGFT